MAEKTYNTGRVVGWSTYEEFLKETGADPNVITSYMYNTLVTYGVTRVVELSSREDAWKPSKGGQFYTQTVRVQGASWGAVPIVGIDYESYLDVFTDPHKSSQDVESVDVVEKSALEEAIGNIFAVYVSDAEGKKMQSSVSDHGYLTFAAYPDILKFNTDISGFPGGMMRLIVRGLSMEDLDVNTLYFGPQGFVFAGNGLVEDCYHETRDISSLCMNSGGYLWMSMGGNPEPADFRGLVNHPNGNVLVSSFGYLDFDFLDGTGQFEQKGRYALSYEEYIAAVQGLKVTTTQVDIIPKNKRQEYVYMIAGQPSYEDYPPSAYPFFIIPVRASNGYTNFGFFSGFSTPKLRNNKVIDFTRSYPSGTTDNQEMMNVLYLYDKKLPDYLGSYWGGSKRDIGLVYAGNNTFNSSWRTTPLTNATFFGSGRQRACRSTNSEFTKPNFYVLYNQSDRSFDGIYICTKDSKHDGTSYSLLNRRGSYINAEIPEFVTDKEKANAGNFTFEFTIPTIGHTVKVQGGVLYVDGNPVYPGELLMLGDSEDYRLLYVWQTLDSDGTTPKLVLDKSNIPSLDLGESVSTVADTHSRIFTTTRTAWNTAIKKISRTVYTGVSTSWTFTMTDSLANQGVGLGLFFDLKHNTSEIWGTGKSYNYIIQSIDDNTVRFASAMVWIDNPKLTEVAGYPGTYNALVPRYNQDIPVDGSYFYNMQTVFAKTRASKFFEDFGWNIADYVHEDFQALNLGEFLQEATVRSDLSQPRTLATLRSSGLSAKYHLYSKKDLNLTNTIGKIPRPTASKPIVSSITISASTSATSFFSTAFYEAKDKDGATVQINNLEYPIWATIAKSRFGDQVMSVSLIDSSGNRLDFSGNQGNIEADKITWLDLLIGLGSGQAVDLLHGMVVRKDANDCNYLITADGTRLYISTEEPKGDDILDGSIGIGW